MLGATPDWKLASAGMAWDRIEKNFAVQQYVKANPQLFPPNTSAAQPPTTEVVQAEPPAQSAPEAASPAVTTIAQSPEIVALENQIAVTKRK